jgi:hypothetical protein
LFPGFASRKRTNSTHTVIAEPLELIDHEQLWKPDTGGEY